MLQYNGLPFGLASGPKLFITKMMKPIIALVRRIGVRLVIYLYDIVLLHCKSITGRALKRQRNTFMVASQSRLVNKLGKKISPKPMPATIISGSNNKFIENGNNFVSNQSRECQKKMYRYDKQNRSANTRAIKFNGNTKYYSRSCHPSITIGEGASNFQNKMLVKSTNK